MYGNVSFAVAQTCGRTILSMQSSQGSFIGKTVAERCGEFTEL
ncbi:MAG TPA: hypothetical protein PK683_01955 [Leptospiraceae bacterium]|nr:hypothetical protein [Leptospiraceae bacterium]